METAAESTGCSEVDLDEIVRELADGVDKLPRKAIQAARQYRDRMIPRLIRVIEDATARTSAGEEVEGNAHFFALFLLTEFEAKEALPTILKAMSLPGEGPHDLFGDAVTGNLPSVLAALSADSPETIDGLITNRSLDEYVRWSAVSTYLLLVRDGRLTRDEAVERLRGHLREAIAHKDEDVAGPLVCELCDFAAKDSLEDIQEAYRLDLVDFSLIDLEHIEASIARADAEFQRALKHCRPTGIADTIEELETWASFSEEADRRPHVSPEAWQADDYDGFDDELEDLDEEPYYSPATIINEGPRIGRNAPCPCGSGRKYKKCCGAT